MAVSRRNGLSRTLSLTVATARGPFGDLLHPKAVPFGAQAWCETRHVQYRVNRRDEQLRV